MRLLVTDHAFSSLRSGMICAKQPHGSVSTLGKNMRIFLPFVALLFLSGCISRLQFREGSYDAGEFRVRYAVTGSFVPHFTHAYTSPVERADGAVFITAFVHPGLLTEHHDGGFGIHVIPASRFENEAKTEVALAAIISSSLRKSRPDEFVEVTIETLGERPWVIAKTFKSTDQRIIMGAACYSYATDQSIVYSGWAFYDGISENEFQKWIPKIRDTLARINIEKKRPNKALEPIPVSVTPPATQEIAPLTSMAHLRR